MTSCVIIDVLPRMTVVEGWFCGVKYDRVPAAKELPAAELDLIKANAAINAAELDLIKASAAINS